MSEQPFLEAAPPEEDSGPAAAEPEKRQGRSGWIAPAWFLFGIIVGIVGFAAYNAFIVKSPATVSQAGAVDSATLKVAAREGFLEAIATLQAEQQAAQQPQGPQAVPSNAFAVRAANRQGSADAKVTVYEFSDFQ